MSVLFVTVDVYGSCSDSSELTITHHEAHGCEWTGESNKVIIIDFKSKVIKVYDITLYEFGKEFGEKYGFKKLIKAWTGAT